MLAHYSVGYDYVLTTYKQLENEKSRSSSRMPRETIPDSSRQTQSIFHAVQVVSEEFITWVPHAT